MSNAPRQMDIGRRHHRLIGSLGNVDDARQGVLRVLQLLCVANERADFLVVRLRESASYNDLTRGKFIVAAVAGGAALPVCSFGNLVYPLPATLTKDRAHCGQMVGSGSLCRAL
jgi:hypothetical protein